MGAGVADVDKWTRLNTRTNVLVREAREDDPDSLVDTGRLLLALAACDGSIASAVLGTEGIDIAAFTHLHGHFRDPGPRNSITPAAFRAVKSASGYAEAFGDRRASSGHLLLGVLDELDGVAMLLLGILGVERRRLAARTRAHLHAARAAGTLEERGPEEQFVMSGVETLPATPSQVHAAFARRCAADPALSMAVAEDGVVEIAQSSEGADELALCFRFDDAAETEVEWMVSLRVPVYSARHRETLAAETEKRRPERSRHVGEWLRRLVAQDGPRPDAAEVAP